MAKVFTFSAASAEDIKLVEAVKKHCSDKKLIFSGVIIDLLKKMQEEQANGKR